MTSQRIFNINFNINKIAKNINRFVLVAPISTIYKDKTSINMYVPLFCPTLYMLQPHTLWASMLNGADFGGNHSLSLFVTFNMENPHFVKLWNIVL